VDVDEEQIAYTDIAVSCTKRIITCSYNVIGCWSKRKAVKHIG